MAMKMMDMEQNYYDEWKVPKDEKLEKAVLGDDGSKDILLVLNLNKISDDKYIVCLRYSAAQENMD